MHTILTQNRTSLIFLHYEIFWLLQDVIIHNSIYLWRYLQEFEGRKEGITFGLYISISLTTILAEALRPLPTLVIGSQSYIFHIFTTLLFFFLFLQWWLFLLLTSSMITTLCSSSMIVRAHHEAGHGYLPYLLLAWCFQTIYSTSNEV